MPEQEEAIPQKAKAVLEEIRTALDNLIATGDTWTIFIDKMALTEYERQTIRDLLGQGGVRIKIENSEEPVEWLESEISGVWYGVFYDQTLTKPLLETIEIAYYPMLAAAQPEDMEAGQEKLKNLLVQL
ncbi:MAG: HupH hydrogenase expression protein [Firmicutes bacterium]|nr:HupH hydrogenase expression protein [Bacillota bacterium]